MNQFCKREYSYEGDVLYQKCTKCGKRKTSEEYHKDKNGMFGITPSCKECRRYIRKEYYWDNKDIENNRYRNYRINNQEREKERHRKYREKNIHKRRELNREIANKHSEEMGFNWGSFHDKANRYVRDNGLRPIKCPLCGGGGRIEMHHPSYNKYDDWSKVVFCCQSCHSLIHSGRIECPKTINLLNLD